MLTSIRTCRGAAGTLALVAACAVDAPAVADTGAPADRARGAIDARAVGEVFDASRIQVGDTVAGLRVVERQVQRAADGEWVGTVRFAGTIPVHGRTIAHPDYPDVAEPCFVADEPTAAPLPRWSGDTRRAWFCFENPAMARAHLGAPDPPRAASIVVSRFTIHYARSDVVNTARLDHLDTAQVVTGAP